MTLSSSAQATSLRRRVRSRRRKLDEKEIPEARPSTATFSLREMIFDPLAARELSGVARRWQTYAARLVYVALIGVLLVLFWNNRIKQTPYLSPSEYANLGYELFTSFFWLQFAFITVAAVALASDRIAREARAGTLGLLLLTPLSSRRIAFGKWKAVMAEAGNLILCGMPVPAICLYLGGVGIWELAWSVTMTLAHAGVAAAASLKYSASSAGGMGAMLKSLGALVGYALLPLVAVPAALIAPAVFYAACFIHPLYAAIGAMEVRNPLDPLSLGWLVALPVSTWMTWKLLGAASRGLRRRALQPPPPPRLASDPALFEENYSRSSLHGPRILTVRRAIWENFPLLWKEFTLRPAARIAVGARVLVFAILFTVVFLCWKATAGQSEETFYGLGAVFVGLAVIQGASLFAREKECGGCELLLTTPLSPWRIVRAKLAAGLLAPEPIWIVALWFAMVGGWTGRLGREALLILAAGSACFLLFAYLLGAAASLWARTFRSALLFTGGIISFVTFGLPWLCSILQASSPNPPAEGILRLMGMAPPSALREALSSPGIPLSEAPDVLLFQLALYGVTGAVLIAAMVRRFSRITSR